MKNCVRLKHIGHLLTLAYIHQALNTRVLTHRTVMPLLIIASHRWRGGWSPGTGCPLPGRKIKGSPKNVRLRQWTARFNLFYGHWWNVAGHLIAVTHRDSHHHSV